MSCDEVNETIQINKVICTTNMQPVTRHCLAIEHHKPETLGTTAVCCFLDAAIPSASQHHECRTQGKPSLNLSTFEQDGQITVLNPSSSTCKHVMIFSPRIFQSSSSLSLRDTEVTPSVLPCMLTA